jgi:acetyltransferase-like isoleucine patch superfamily enzyme
MVPIPILLLFDLLGLVFMALEISAPVAFLIAAGGACLASHGWVGLLVASPLLLAGALASFCAAIFFLRVLVPRPREGEFPFPGHAVSRAWAMNLQIARLPQSAAIRPLFMGTNLFRFLYLRALGAKASFRINTSADVSVLDDTMVEIGEGALIGLGTTVLAHYVDGKKLVYRRTVIGKGTQIGAFCLVGPGTVFGENVTVAPYAGFAAAITVGAKSKIGHNATIEPGTAIGTGVTIGAYSLVQAKCEIGDGAVVAPGAVVPKGTKIAAGARFEK